MWTQQQITYPKDIEFTHTDVVQSLTKRDLDDYKKRLGEPSSTPIDAIGTLEQFRRVSGRVWVQHRNVDKKVARFRFRCWVQMDCKYICGNSSYLIVRLPQNCNKSKVGWRGVCNTYLRSPTMQSSGIWCIVFPTSLPKSSVAGVMQIGSFGRILSSHMA